MKKDQRQQGGSDSTNLQAGHDLTVNYGISTEAALQIAEQVVERKLLELKLEAFTTVEMRLAEFRSEMVARITSLDARLLDSFKDPDIQLLLGEAQTIYARSGEPHVKRTLADLIASRCASEAGSVRAIATRQAIDSIKNLTLGQINALTILFILTQAKYPAIHNDASFQTWSSQSVEPFVDSLPVGDVEYSHLSSSGCANRRTGAIVDLAVVLTQTYPGLFQRGLSLNEVSDDLWDGCSPTELFIPCLNDPKKYQVNAIDMEAAAARATTVGLGDLSDKYAALLHRTLDWDEVRAKACRLHPAWTKLFEIWTNTPLKSLAITTVGVVMAHCHYTSRTGLDVPLSIWLPE